MRVSIPPQVWTQGAAATCMQTLTRHALSKLPLLSTVSLPSRAAQQQVGYNTAQVYIGAVVAERCQHAAGTSSTKGARGREGRVGRTAACRDAKMGFFFSRRGKRAAAQGMGERRKSAFTSSRAAPARRKVRGGGGGAVDHLAAMCAPGEQTHRAADNGTAALPPLAQPRCLGAAAESSDGEGGAPGS